VNDLQSRHAAQLKAASDELKSVQDRNRSDVEYLERNFNTYTADLIARNTQQLQEIEKIYN
jgi:hypothetical protein